QRRIAGSWRIELLVEESLEADVLDVLDQGRRRAPGRLFEEARRVRAGWSAADGRAQQPFLIGAAIQRPLDHGGAIVRRLAAHVAHLAAVVCRELVVAVTCWLREPLLVGAAVDGVLNDARAVSLRLRPHVQRLPTVGGDQEVVAVGGCVERPSLTESAVACP